MVTFLKKENLLKCMEKILVLDFGSQYTHLIARRIRQLGVYSEIKHPGVSWKDLKDVKGIILSGGPTSVHEKDAPTISKRILNSKTPVLGICYGHQLIAHSFGGKLESGNAMEYGFARLKIKQNPLFEDLEQEETVWMSHGDHVTELPLGFESIGATESSANAAVCNEDKKLFGLQFHPEVTHTRNGMKILDNFLKICNVERNWNVGNYLEHLKQEIKENIKNKKVFLLVSGGVDSTVAFMLLNEALGPKKVLGLHIDNGLMRLDESKHIVRQLKRLGLAVRKLDASKEFLRKLVKVTDPERKRKIIGKAFIDVTNKELKKLGLDKGWILGQGTIYPDTIESGSTKNSAKIKTHHNRVDIVKKLISEGKIIEPLRELYKDEVRALGKKLNVPIALLRRHPFPGPGLAVRCLCQDKPKKVSKKVEEQVADIVEPFFLDSEVLPIKSVGVQGDSRSYRNPVMVMGDSDWDTLNKIATLVCNNVKEVNRVVWHIAGERNLKPKKAYLTKRRLDLLRGIDFLVREFVYKNGYHSRIWQMPVILIPLSANKKEAVVLRPICSTEVMTANFTRMELGAVKMLAEKILATNKVSAVLYDVTNKPPGTVEWE